MGTGGRDADEFSYPSGPDYRPPIELVGGLLWTLALAVIGGLWFLVDFEAASAVTPEDLVVVGRVFVGVFVFAALFPLVFGLRRFSREA